MVIDLATREKRRTALVWIFCMTLSLWNFGARADVVITTLHSFNTPAVGAQPNTLVLGKDGNLYGTTAGGGAGGHGTVFKFTTNGVLTTLYSFSGAYTGIGPSAALVRGADGNLYGTTLHGGGGNVGTVFKITPQGVLTSLHSFWRGDTDYGNDGFYPRELIQGNDGNLYGVSGEGGSGDRGMVYRVSTNGVFTNLHNFTYEVMYPRGALVQGADGDYYGIAGLGGTNYYGIVFKITANGAVTTVYAFTGTSQAANQLLLGSDGNFYGTSSGGTYNQGAVFRLTTNGVYTEIYSFSGGSDGGGPQLIQGIDGNFYGTTFIGGAHSYGTVFKITVDGALSTLASLSGGIGGGSPNGLVQGPDGSLYGTTRYGGQAGNGTIFKITLDGTVMSLYSFPGAPNDGIYPQGGLVKGIDGFFYGSTYYGGAYNHGTIFKIGPDGAFTSLYSFTDNSIVTNLQTALVQGDDGWLYGTTAAGGTNNYGTVFKISTNGDFASLYSFAGGNDGLYPLAPLVKGADGNLYGTTYGTNSVYGSLYGTVFKISTNGGFTTLHNFAGGIRVTNGTNPKGRLVLGSDGKFYGTTYAGGLNNKGTVFGITTDGVFTRLYSFTNTYPILDGANPAGLVQGFDGNFYGYTDNGGSDYDGSVFKLTTNGLLTSLFGSFCCSPPTGLVPGADGNIYGTVNGRGGYYYTGRLFKITTNGTLTTVHFFYDNDGYGLSELVRGNDGSFYCTSGGGAGYGAILRITIGPVFKAITLTNSTLTLTWSTDAGSTYQLQYKSQLNSDNWLNLGSPILAAGWTLSATDSVANDPQRFYRVVVFSQ